MDSVKLPSFTIPTSKCCSIILPFADIAKALNNEPHIVQVGIGELAKNFYQIENLRINWLFSPPGWPVFVSGFNPGIRPHHPQAFQYDLKNKKLQVTNGISRESLTHEDMARMVSAASNPAVDIASFPCEEGDATTSVPEEHHHEGKGKKLKRKANRRHQSFTDAVEAMKGLEKQKIVCPFGLSSGSEEVDFLGYSSRTVQQGDSKTLRFIQIHDSGSNEDILDSIKSAMKSGDIVETDFPFKLAKEGVLLNGEFQLVNLKQTEFFDDHSELLNFSDPSNVPDSVSEAGAHMKSYIHHLFRCDELSGPILLATVNLYQFEKMFRS